MTFSHPIVEPHHSNLASGSVINDDLDMETAALIAKLALDDLAEVLGCRKGKARADSLPSDEEIAHRLQTEQYNEWLSIVEDAKFAKSIGDALVTDAAYLDVLTTAEEAAAEDRIAAELLSRGEALPVPKSCQTRLEHPAFVMDPVFIATPEMAAVRSDHAGIDASDNPIVKNGLLDDEEESIEGDSDDLMQNSGFSTPRPNTVGKRSVAGPSADRNKRVHCAICHDSFRCYETLNTPCGHYYCRGCLVELVEASTRDESLFPLRCCQDPIPIANVIPALSLKLRTLFQRKQAEFSILSKDRLYCSNPTCSTFLGSSEDRLSLSGIECPNCHVNTCPECKELAHPGEGCGVSASNEALQALVKSKGWQTCPGCHAVVELDHGCYHMTCRCRTEFCYLCAARWKNCECDQWDDARLVTAAQQRVENEVGQAAAQRMAPAVFAERVEQRIATLRDNHHCERHSWRYRQGGGRCEECHFVLPTYLLICRGCSLLACVRCTRNRL
ncbi:hypothetical protein BYT27DRAFT_7222229 [Phlegmacium glaucopus]|nr:hypothetical protein BYT27DRAFT_7222229 [Phlegmacium glaucopus]